MLIAGHRLFGEPARGWLARILTPVAHRDSHWLLLQEQPSKAHSASPLLALHLPQCVLPPLNPHPPWLRPLTSEVRGESPLCKWPRSETELRKGLPLLLHYLEHNKTNPGLLSNLTADTTQPPPRRARPNYT
jgi:hypothetical protein